MLARIANVDKRQREDKPISGDSCGDCLTDPTCAWSLKGQFISVEAVDRLRAARIAKVHIRSGTEPLRCSTRHGRRDRPG